MRAFNLREGLRKRDDTIPDFYFEVESPKYGFKLDRQKFDEILEYYDLRGWDAEGVPRSDRLSALGLDDVRDELKGSQHHPVKSGLHASRKLLYFSSAFRFGTSALPQ